MLLPFLSDGPQLTEKLLQAQWDTPVLIALFDSSDSLRWANPAFRQAYALGENQVLTWSDLARHSHESRVGALIETDDFENWLASARSRRGKQEFRAFECDLRDGRWLWMTETVLDDGSMLCVASDITRLRRTDRDIRLERGIAQRAALTDSLTGISNRAHIIRQLEEHLQQTRTHGVECAIAMLDLDFFKRVNDNYGHLAGDTVLRHFAQFLRRMLRREDGLGRLGGEEFLVLLPGASATQLAGTMNRLLTALTQERPLDTEPDFFYSCSIGGSLLHPHDTLDTALDRVDAALYTAKNEGRNRFVWVSPSGSAA